MFVNWQGINPMGLSSSLANHLKTILHQHENFTNIIKMKHKINQGIYSMGLFAPWSEYFINNQKFIKT